MSYIQFCEAMTEAMNQEAMKRADRLVTVSYVAGLPESMIAFQATVSMAQAIAKI